MRKALIITLVVGFFVVLNPFQAQSQFFIGAKIGGTSSSLTATGLEQFQPTPKMYFNGGLASSFSFGKRFAVTLEFNYSGKGSAIQYYGEYETWSGLISLDQRLHYFAIPLMLQYKLGDRDNFFHLDAGIVPNTLIGSKFIGDITVEKQNGDIETHNLELEFNPLKSDFSYAFGIGLMANGIAFDFRYEIGTREVYLAEPNAPKIYNRAFTITVGYMFNLL